MTAIRVHKRNHRGESLWHYDGTILARTENMIQLEAFFNRDDYAATYHTFRRGDRMVEWFYADRWYNIFQLHDVADDRITGWYCNITRPAHFEADAIYADDLALDVMVYPDGRVLVLDEDEFAQLDLDAADRQNALDAVQEIKKLVEQRDAPFHVIVKGE